jgi:hypothetical protein
MATVFIGLVLLTFVVNAIITKSKTQWWRDPGSLFRAESESEPVPAREVARVRQPWEVTPRRELPARPGARTGRHAVRSNLAVPIEHAETEVFDRIPGGRAQ